MTHTSVARPPGASHGVGTIASVDGVVRAGVDRLLRAGSGEAGVERASAPRVAFLPDDDRGGPMCVAAWPGSAPMVSDVVPLFEQFGLRLAGIEPLEGVALAGCAPALSSTPHNGEALPGENVTLTLQSFRTGWPDWDGECARLVEQAFPSASAPAMIGDPFTRLVVGARLPLRDVQLLRAATGYLRQVGLGNSPAYVADILARHPDLVRALTALFRARFHPHVTDRAAAVAHARGDVVALLDRASTLDEDKVLRALASFVAAVLRTNWYRVDEDGRPRTFLSFKLDPSRLSVRGPVTPYREIFVHAAEMEGTHLRAGAVARGGIRWSDRPEDYRVEVCGLLKTQRVKNAVIVPDGAKGAFVVRAGADPASCYDTFIRGLLDVTDDIVDGTVATPDGVVAHDGADPYLVVAADKGTARYSDRANAIAVEQGFWLGDAFAAGGSTGYDHKQMGITARGAWVAVAHHLAERGIDVERDTFTVAGIGDMSGDVFGNGMLLARGMRLVAAFDHRHVFLDPDPDPAVSYRERERLARLPGSSWDDYERKLISPGGGVWSRTAKRIPISEAAREALGLGPGGDLSPDEVIRAILCAPVDLLWNGGIGTYVKAGTESHLDAADPGNDSVRVDATQLRCAIVGEGGNLGLTQRARIEFALAGGRLNGDFIDNAAGVDTSDREVNIKILLSAAEADGAITRAERDAALTAAAGEVTQAVLDDCARQNLAISLSESQAPLLLDRHARLIRHLEKVHGLDRETDGLPGRTELRNRARNGQGLTRPEIAVLLAHSKNVVRDDLLASEVPDHPAFRAVLHEYFPASLRQRFARWIPGHRLAREIVATCLANDLVNHLGPGLIQRMDERFGAESPQVVLALAAVRAVFDTGSLWTRTLQHDDLPAEVQRHVLHFIQDFVEKATSWFLRSRGPIVEPAREQALLHFAAGEVGRHLAGRPDAGTMDALVGRGVPGDLARVVSSLPQLARALDAMDLAVQLGMPPTDLVEAASTLDRELDLDYVGNLADVPGALHWESMATSVLRDDLAAVRREILVRSLTAAGGAQRPGGGSGDPVERHPVEVVQAWLARRPRALQRVRATISELRTFPRLDIAMACTAVADLRLLVRPGTDEGAGPGADRPTVEGAPR